MATSYTSDRLVERLRDYKMTPAEKRRQRVSLIMGLRASRSTLTRENVEKVLSEVEGSDAGTTSMTRG